MNRQAGLDNVIYFLIPDSGGIQLLLFFKFTDIKMVLGHFLTCGITKAEHANSANLLAALTCTQ